MKYLLAIDNLGSGGSERQMLNLAEYIRSAGHDVMMLVYSDEEFHREEAERHSIMIENAGHEFVPSMVLRTVLTVRRFRPEYIVAFLPPQIIMCQIACLFYKPKCLVISMRSANEQGFENYRMRIMSRLFRTIDFIVCNSVNEASVWKRYFPAMAPKTRVIRNSVQIDEARFAVPGGRADDRVRLVVAATYYHVKNINGLIEALHMLPEEALEHLSIDWYGRKDFRKGDTRAYDEATAKRKAYHLEKCLYLHDRTYEIYDRMVNADAIGLFSFFEGMPNAICEGMMLRKLIVMTKVSDYEMLAGSGNGIICASCRPEDIAAALTKLLSLTPEERYQMGELSWQIARERFSKEAVQNAWNQVLRVHE